jgi:hypothetical protein
MRAKVARLAFPAGRRILAVSDIHGNLPYLKGLLRRVNFSATDELVIVGDMLEKGPQSLDTLRFIMELCRGGNVHPIQGNCDGWHALAETDDPDAQQHILRYLLAKPQALLSQMCAEIGYPITGETNTLAMRGVLAEAFAPEFAFLHSLPTILETPHYTFVHGGLPEGKLEELDAFACMKNDNFMRQGRHFDKWCVVGHWPVMLYGGDTTCANPIIDRESRIISIDGGCVLKDDGQLNALIIPYDGREDFAFDHYDAFPTARTVTAQRGSDRSIYVRYGDNLVRVLRRGGEFSLCEHVRTGYRLEILTKYLRGQGETVRCNDCTDYVLPLRAGDEVSVVERTSRGWLVKHGGVSGWYLGDLEPLPGESNE